MVARTLGGLEPLLARELTALGATNVKEAKRAVTFNGGMETMMKANLWCRTALRILIPIHKFTAMNEEALYEGVSKVKWNSFMTIDHTFAVDSTTNGTIFTHSKYAALVTKDAIVDQFRKIEGRRPDVDTEKADLRIHIHIKQSLVTISLDSSGRSLHMRGYRGQEVDAPINEVLAAGMIMMSGWDKKSDFYDFMCGSGTIPIEAALMASNRAPGLINPDFTFLGWDKTDQKTWDKVVEEARKAEKAPEGKFFGSDIDGRAVGASKSNAQDAGIFDLINFEKADFRNVKPEAEGGCLIVNPPYGERLDDTDIGALYKEIGDKWKTDFPGFNAWIVSSNMGALKKVGLRPSKKYQMFNGPLECKLQGYELYSGSRKEE